ncbi:M1 family metallopeptidase [Actinoplanes derwentensis]|uniref:Aminopeptidase N n=1 Tax=Actinoplanes derwentensis TaxID=113562 RepID=A0A1H2CL41_9ACTN|nr:M1 family metallopeptidase [Actinoplanes derwentensis]GID82672.1 peptidase [Actinoplanes derwentensis]SDT70932.1 Peptidase family M1 [Actinoplanes derwentensis]
MRRRGGALVLLLVLSGCSTPPPAKQPAFAPGADGAGDPYFPKYGNGGYDVAGYDLNLTYEPTTNRLAGTATITATAVQDLSRFNLDLSGLTASEVTVDGTEATATAEGAELVVTPAAGLIRGRPFTAVVTYSGTPGPIENDTLGTSGWLRSGKTGAIALGQPESASTWFPVNDHPTDKATFKLAMSVPEGVEVLSNGVPGEHRTSGGRTIWHWSEDSPMASYLSTVVIGQYRITSGAHQGRPMVTAIPESLPADGDAARSLARTGEVTDFLETQFGPYPFSANGGVVVDDDQIRYALETQSRPVYGNTFFVGGENTQVVAHELAHQWFGDSVALTRWQDIWLNEGFATYAEWLWSEHSGDETAQELFDEQYRAFNWSETPGDPTPQRLFGNAVYQRGGMTVHALRKTIGDKAFFTLVKDWTAQHRNGNVTTAQFITAASAAAGKPLDSFFEAWLNGTTKPTI